MMIHTITAGLYDSLIVDLEAHSNNSDLDTLLVINSCSSKSHFAKYKFTFGPTLSAIYRVTVPRCPANDG